MPNPIRLLFNRARAFIRNRRHAKRHNARLPFSLFILDKRLLDERLVIEGERRTPRINGMTRDLSSSGLGLILPAIRIGRQYITTEDQKLRIILDLPLGPVEMNVIAARFHQLDDRDHETGYLIGVRIAGMSDRDREQFESYLKTIR